MLARFRLLAGHFPHHALPLIPVEFTTVGAVRDPLTRTVSHFSTLKASEPAFADLTLDRFVVDEGFDAVVGNYQARRLTHDVDLGGAWIRYSPDAEMRQRGVLDLPPNPLAALFDADPLDSDETSLLSAAANVESIDVVGTTDELDRVAAVAAGLPGRAGPVTLPRLNRSEPSPSGVLTDAVRRRIETRTQVDNEIYRLAAKRSTQLTIET